MIRRMLMGIFITGIVLGLVPGAAAKDDAVSRAEKGEKNRPGILETKAVAEEGFIYGLPIVMNYAVMYDYVLDRNSGQWKAPFNQISNEHRVFTYEDTAIVTPNSDTPYSMAWMDLRADPVVLSVPAVEKKRYYSVMLIDGNCFNHGYIGNRATGNEAGDYMVVGPDWKGQAPPGIKKVFPSTTQSEGVPGKGQGIQLAARSRRPHLHGHAALLAEDRAAVHSAAGRRHVAAAGAGAGEVTGAKRYDSSPPFTGN